MTAVSQANTEPQRRYQCHLSSINLKLGMLKFPALENLLFGKLANCLPRDRSDICDFRRSVSGTSAIMTERHSTEGLKRTGMKMREKRLNQLFKKFMFASFGF